MTFDVEAVYALLPALYRIRDIELAEQLPGVLDATERAELQSLRSRSTLSAQDDQRRVELEARQRGPLKAFLAILAEQLSVLEDNLDQLYDDLFIETCAEWVVPYIGDLIGTRATAIPSARFTQRAFVANTMAYRRRKGTAAVLEQLARDTSGWNASVVEYLQVLATTQYLNHLRLPDELDGDDRDERLSLRSLPVLTASQDQRRLELDELQRALLGIRSVADLRNSKALEAIGTPFDPLTRTADVRRIEPRRGQYNIPNVGIFLYRIANLTVTDAPAFQLDSQRYLFDALGADQQLYNDPETEDAISHLAEPINVPLPLTRRGLDRDKALYYGTDKSLSIAINTVPLASSDIIVCDLSDVGPSWAHTPSVKVAIDPVLGRIALPGAGSPPPSVRVSYSYGFSAEMGGGEYEREPTFVGTDSPIEVTADRMQQGLDQAAASGGVVQITNNDYFVGTPILTVGTGAGTRIELRSAPQRRAVLVLASDWSIAGADESEVTLNGLLISGGLRIPLADVNGKPNTLRLLRLRHCTLVPGARAPMLGLPAAPAGPRLIVDLPDTIVEIDQCIVGGIRAVEGSRVRITNSILDSTDAAGVAFSGLLGDDAGAPLEIANTTVIGKVHTLTMTLASNAIFLSDLKAGDGWPAPVRAARLQQGCVRFSFVPPGSELPRLYHCQPAAAADAPRVRPTFSSLGYGDAGYCQLSQHCAVEIRQGADDGAEMGAFHDLYQPQREASVRASLDDYLRFGAEAGIFFAS